MIRERVSDLVSGIQGDVKSITGALFWGTLGSLATLYMVAPEAALTQQLLPLEIGLLVGLGLGYLSFRRSEA